MIFLPFLLAASAAAQSASSTTVCIAGQCLTGQSNVSIGASITTPSGSMILLPGQYTSSSGPQQLSSALATTSAAISALDGFTPRSGTLQLPLNVALLPGILSYPNAPFSGRGAFRPLANSTSNNASAFVATDLQTGSLLVSSNTWAAIESDSGSTKSRVVVWENVPFLSQVPSTLRGGSLKLLDMQSSACSPPCAGAGVCTTAGTCSCPTGYTGQSCETCAKGFFGPSCSPCPSGCTKCDEGLSGLGVCLSPPSAANAPSTCKCLNGVCGTGGQCTCNPGWTTATGGTACSTCAPGFFQDNNGDCSVCQLGCSQCQSGTGICTQCTTGFTADANDRTKCVPTPTIGAGGIPCPDGSFASSTNAACQVCSPLCKTCRGPSSSDCVVCGPGRYNLGGSCVATDGSGVCTGSTLVANNLKSSCDSCPSKCTACNIPNFSVASTFNQVVCTKCLPGSVLSGGKCIDECPAGTFVGADGVTCTPCDSSCKSCAGDAKFCLSCASSGQLALAGKCTASCPPNTFASNGACLSCHSDCATCSGSGFNQCTSCSASRPVPQLSNGSGRCLPTCSKTEYFDPSSSSCKACDASCSSCSAGGSQGCLACATPGQVLRNGACVAANCDTVPGLGVCLSELVIVPGAPMPPPAVETPPEQQQPRVIVFEWWQILLMVLGGCFIIGIIFFFWRRKARKTRAKETAAFAKKKEIEKKGFRRTLGAWFGIRQKRRSDDLESKSSRSRHSSRSGQTWSDYSLHHADGASQHGRSHRSGSRLMSERGATRRPSYNSNTQFELDNGPFSPIYTLHTDPSLSMYSESTGEPHHGPQAKQPLRHQSTSRWSDHTRGTQEPRKPKYPSPEPGLLSPKSDADAYKLANTPKPESYWDAPTATATTNPFRRVQ